jgi:predicted N-acetyltransferase YhbS
VREGTPPYSQFCRAAFIGDRMIAAVRFTPVTIGGSPGALLLGPLAVDTEFAGNGYGRALIGQSIEAAKAAGLRLIVLVGDEPYYSRFGFRAVMPGQITLPGPVDPARILAAELEPGALAAFRGPVVAAHAT